MRKLIINLKTYEESTGERAVEIAKICKKLEDQAKAKDVEIIICPQIIDIREIIQLGIKVYTQHMDNYNYGAHTGFTIPQALKDAGVSGTLISHSEHRLKISEIEEELNTAKKLGLETCVCARNANKASEVAKLSPDFVAIEPKELIGGNISISTAEPELIEDSIKAVGNIPLLVGAGIKNTQDVRKGIEYGAKGILVASGVIKAQNIEETILELLNGF